MTHMLRVLACELCGLSAFPWTAEQGGRLAGPIVGENLVRPQSWRVGRAVLCTPDREHSRAAACRGLPAVPPPAITTAIDKVVLSTM